MLEIQSVTHAIQVLNVLSSSGSELGLVELAQKLNMSNSTVARLLYTLEKGEILQRSKVTGKYRLGLKLVEYTGVLFSQLELRKIALPYLQELNAKTGETVDLYLLRGNHRVSIERFEGLYEVRFTSGIGRPGPLHAGASGKLLLAYTPDEERNKLIDSLELTKFTPQTITDRTVLEKDLEKICEQGFAVSFQEHLELVNAISVPVRDYTGNVIAALGVSGLITHFTENKIEQHKEIILRTSQSISKEMGYLLEQNRGL